MNANPFPGLRPFEAEETHLFFGRDGQSTAIIAQLQRTRFVGVVGTSGSGKSSLVRAGLLPQLEGGFMASAGSFWRFAVMKPGDAPMHHLAEALAGPGVLGEGASDPAARAAQLEAVLRRGSLGLIDAVRQARLEEGDNLLVVVDQFEEIFRMARLRSAAGQDEAALFVALLLEAAAQATVPIYIVLTMRSDFLGDCAQFRDLPEALNRGQYLVPRMSRDERRAAIEGPVAVGGAQIAPRLVQLILNEVGDSPDQLPVMQHALMRTWDEWVAEGRPDTAIDIEHYRQVGGLAQALSRHAQAALDELTGPRQADIARRLFQRLCERAADYRETRRPTRLAELALVADASEAEVVAVIDRFRTAGRTFLVPQDGVALNSTSVIDISHEALIRQWQTLRGWVDEEAAAASVYRRLAADAALFEDKKVALWVDPQLSSALDWRSRLKPTAAWAARYDSGFDAAMAFLDNSAAARKRSRVGRVALLGLVPLGLVAWAVITRILTVNGQLEARTLELNRTNGELSTQATEIQRQKDELQRLSLALVDRNESLTQSNSDLAAASKLADYKTRLAEGASERAQRAQKQATASRLAVQSLLERDSAVSSLLAAESLALAHTPETEAAMWRALGRPARLPSLRQPELRGLVLSADGARAATMGAGGELVLWDAAKGSVMARVNPPGAGFDSPIVISAAGDRVFVGGDSGAPLAYELRGGKLEALPLPEGGPHQTKINKLVASPNGQWLASADAKGVLAVWRAEGTLALHGTPPAHARAVQSLAFDGSGRWFASAGNDRMVQVYDTTLRAPALALTPPGGVQPSTPSILASSPRVQFLGPRLLVHFGDRVELRDAPAFEARKDGPEFLRRDLRNMAIGPAGRHLLAASTDGTLVKLTEGAKGLLPGLMTSYGRFGGGRQALPQGGGFESLVESPDERLIAFVARDRYGNAAGTHIVVASPSAPQAATVWGMSGLRITGLLFADRGRQLWVNTGDEVLRFSLADLITPVHTLRLTGGRAVSGLALGNDGSVAAIDADNSLFRRGGAPGARLEGSSDDWGNNRRQSERPYGVVPAAAAIVSSPVRRAAQGDGVRAGLAWQPATGPRIDLPVTVDGDDAVLALAGNRSAHLAWALRPDPKSPASRIQVWHAPSATLRHSIDSPGEVRALALDRDAETLAAVVVLPRSADAAPAGPRRPSAADTVTRLLTWKLPRDGGAPIPGQGFDAIDTGRDEFRVSFSPLGRWLTVTNEFTSITDLLRWPWADGAPVRRVETERFDFSADEKQLLALDRERGLVLIDLGQAEAEPRRLLASDAGIRTVAASPDGRWFMAGSGDGSLHVWDAASAEPRALLRWAHRSPLVSIAHSADGGHFTTGDVEGVVATWSTATLARAPSIAQALCLQAGSNLSDAAWQTYLRDETYRKTCPSLPVGEGVAMALTRQAWEADEKGRRDEARRIVKRIVLMAEPITAAGLLNNLCYRAALSGAGLEALPLCERAVAADPQRPHVRDSRAVALILAGRRAEAIADLEYAIGHTDFPESVRESRAAWLQTLRRGGQPLDLTTLKAQRKDA